MRTRGLIRAYDSQIQIAQRFMDAAIIAGVFVFAVWLRGAPWNDKYTIATTACILFFYLFASVTRLYQSHRIGGLASEARPVVASWVATVGSLMVLGYVLKSGADFSRIAVGIAIVLTPMVLIAWRWLVRVTLMQLRSNGRNNRSVAIVGAGEAARELAASIRSRPWTGLNVLGFVVPCGDETDSKLALQDGSVMPRLGDIDDLYRRARANEIDVVYIAVPLNDRETIDSILRKLGDTTVSLYLVPDMYTAGIMQGQWVTIGTVPTISIIDTPTLGIGSWVKRLEDIVVSVLVLGIMAIPMALIAIGIKLTSKGPVLYVQKRYGVNCAPIDVYKFRTMTVTETDEQFTQARPADPRVTPFGAFLRRTSLDELPQFFNVLAGTMSVVGPRPHPIALNEEYRGKVDAYTLRHKIKPGITGLAQINGYRGQTPHDGAMKDRVRHDIEYINGWSIWLDLKIMLATPLALFRGENAH